MCTFVEYTIYKFWYLTSLYIAVEVQNVCAMMDKISHFINLGFEGRIKCTNYKINTIIRAL